MQSPNMSVSYKHGLISAKVVKASGTWLQRHIPNIRTCIYKQTKTTCLSNDNHPKLKIFNITTLTKYLVFDYI